MDYPEINDLSVKGLKQWKGRKTNDLIWDTLAFVGALAIIYWLAIIIL